MQFTIQIYICPEAMEIIVMSLKISDPISVSTETPLDYIWDQIPYVLCKNLAMNCLLCYVVPQPCHLGKSLRGQVSGLAFLSHLLQHFHCVHCWFNCTTGSQQRSSPWPQTLKILSNNAVDSTIPQLICMGAVANRSPKGKYPVYVQFQPIASRWEVGN